MPSLQCGEAYAFLPLKGGLSSQQATALAHACEIEAGQSLAEEQETPQERHALYMGRAAEAEQQAARTVNLDTKESLRSIAKSWRRLAREIEIKELGLG